MKKEEIAEWKFEIRWRKELIKRLEFPLHQLKKYSEKAHAENAAKLAAKNELISRYDSVEDAHEAYGYDSITEEEYHTIEDAFEHQEQAEQDFRCVADAALAELKDFVGRHEKAIRSLEYDLLPEAERQRILAQAEQLQERIKQKKEGTEAKPEQ